MTNEKHEIGFDLGSDPASEEGPWLAKLVSFGVAQFESYLANRARFYELHGGDDE